MSIFIFSVLPTLVAMLLLWGNVKEFRSDGRPWWRAILPVLIAFLAITFVSGCVKGADESAGMSHRYDWMITIMVWAASGVAYWFVIIKPAERTAERLNGRDVARFGELVAIDVHGFHPETYTEVTQRLTRDFLESKIEPAEHMATWVSRAKSCSDSDDARRLWDWYNGRLDTQPDSTSTLGESHDSAL